MMTWRVTLYCQMKQYLSDYLVSKYYEVLMMAWSVAPYCQIKLMNVKGDKLNLKSQYVITISGRIALYCQIKQC